MRRTTHGRWNDREREILICTLLVIALSILSLFIWLKSPTMELITCPMICSLPLDSSWTNGLVVPSIDFIRFRMIVTLDETETEDKLYSAIQSSVSRIWMIRWRSPLGNRTTNWEWREKAMMVNCVGSVFQSKWNNCRFSFDHQCFVQQTI